MATFTLSMPDDVAQAAAEFGLLDSAALTLLLQAELRRRAFADLQAGSSRLAAAGTHPMTECEIQAEIRAARAEERASCP